MIHIKQCKLPIRHTEKDLYEKAARLLGVRVEDILFLEPVRKSLDARKKNDMCYVYELKVGLDNEKKLGKKLKLSETIAVYQESPYRFPIRAIGLSEGKKRPVIVGMGPAGLFCGYLLALHGFRPILLERGETVEKRAKSVEQFWKGGALNPESNVQFGEGGAGTFSDGKLTTMIKDKEKRGKFVLETLVRFGAEPSILYQNKPHMGTDVLRRVVATMHEELLRYGAEIHTETRVDSLLIEGDRVIGVDCSSVSDGRKQRFYSDTVVLAIGHSARDTFLALKEQGVPMEAKPFAVGVRMEHPQAFINRAQYGENARYLPPADYKLTARAVDGRGVYSFCMCPGGYVVNASSEPLHLAVNGMSYQDRGSKNANSAIVVSVSPEDFPGEDVLRGMYFQRELEAAAYRAGNGRVPVQTLRAFRENRREDSFFSVKPLLCGAYQPANLREIFPDFLCQALLEGIAQMDERLHGFAMEDALLSAVESRTSSPVKIRRDEAGESEKRGLFPCGEGAGYAGGIVSAAIDGMRIAEELARRLV